MARYHINPEGQATMRELKKEESNAKDTKN